ncbi:FimV/HubP family polar landmark protein [Halomonas denitrificans]|uniref:FimV/HubP family polar landmark protein n=1 Tax=Halomonas denitrificans TaxID=370769 RepID=UPI000DF32285|nr:FimV/HubP family polar landmark protein [Halomonas denitrificans]
MKRKLTLAMLLSLSAASPLALALGLGEAEVNSTLSAPLRASIPLTDSAGLQPGLLNVSVADAEAFAAAGLARTPLAASVKMEVTRRQGRLMVDLTTERAVREPWVDLLLRFDWPGGRQLREVTLLLDPPDYDRLPALVAAPSTPPAAVSGERSVARASDVAPRPVARTASAAGAGDPAWVRPGDTLWAVAGRLRPDSGISMNQMMVALVEANPEVFPSGNINAMRAGFTLVVPPREAIAARSDARAGELVQAMNQAWANRGSGAPARVPLGGAEPAAAVASAGSESPAPTAPDEEASAEPATADAGESGGEGGQRLTLLSDAELAAEDGPSATEAAEGAMEEATDAGAGVRGAGDTPALALSPAERGEGEAIDPEVLAMIQGDGELTEDERLLRLEARWQESQASLEAVRSERDALQAALGDLREEVEVMREQLASLAAGGSGADAAGAGGVVAPGSASEAQPVPWWGALYQGAVDRPLMLGGAGLAALLALWALVRRRRREEEAPAPVFNEARVVDPAASGVVMPGAGDRTADEAPASERDEPQRTPVSASMPEAEAINEADIFIAYGRYDQARELLEASLVREPGRDDLRLKLLRVQLKQGDRNAAARQAERLRADGDPDVQAEVAELMQRHALHTASAAPERAVFPVPDEHQPRRFDEPDAPDEDDAPDEVTAAGEAEAARPTSDDAAQETPPTAPAAAGDEPSPDDRAADLLAAYRPPESDVVAKPAAAESNAAEPGAVHGADEGDGAHEAQHEGLGSEPAPSPAEAPLETVQAEDGRDIIDYRPPTLEANPAPREETPMQPSVDFTPSGLGGGESPSAASGSREGRELSEEWDVEEVAFPPLSRDNDALSAAASPTSTLAEARRLLEAGERGQGRVLLERLIDETDDPDARQEARDLLDQHLP